MMMRVREDAFGNDFLKQFAAALKEADRAVGSGEMVIRFGWLGDDNDKGIRPRVMTKSDRGIEDVQESIGSRPECPFDKLI